MSCDLVRWTLSSGTDELFLRSKLADLLVQLCNEYNGERLMKPFLATLASEAYVLFVDPVLSPLLIHTRRSSTTTEALDLLTSLVRPRQHPEDSTPLLLPTPIITLLTTSTLTVALEATDAAGLVKVLSQVYQRWPQVWETETKSRTSQTTEVDMPKLWTLMNAVLGGGIVSSSEPSGMFLSSSSPDVAVRVLALQDLFKSASDIVEDNPTFVHDTLLARIAEPIAEVVEVVLANKTLSTVHTALSGSEIFSSLVSVLSAPKLNPAVLDVVLPYLAGPFISAHPDFIDAVVEEVFWGRLLSGKNATEERIAGFKALKGSKLEASHAWLKSVGAAFQVGLEEDGTLKNGAQANATVVDTIAKNLAALPSKEFEVAIEFLLSQIEVEATELLADEPSTVKASSELLALLVSAQLAGKMDKSHRLTFVVGIFDSLKAAQQGLDAFTGTQAELILDEKTGALAPLVAQAIFARPQTNKTLRRARAALLISSIASVQHAKSASWIWLASPSTEADDTTSTYRSLITTIYRFAHTGTTLGASSLSTSLLRSLFTSLVTDDVLSFLASIWSSPSTPSALKSIALKDAKTFVQVQASPELKKPTDWQVVVPSVVVALMDKDKKVRSEAIGLLEVVQSTLPKITAHVYGRDKFYGASSGAFTPLSLLVAVHNVDAPRSSNSIDQIPRRSRHIKIPPHPPLLSYRTHHGRSLPHHRPPIPSRNSRSRTTTIQEEGFFQTQSLHLPSRSYPRLVRSHF